MSFLDRFRAPEPIEKINIGNDFEATVKTKKNGDKILLNIIPLPNPRVREDTRTWLDALKWAEHPEFPRRTRLYYVYEAVELDAHLTAIINKRVFRAQTMKFKIMDENDNECPELVNMLQTSWYREYVKLIMNHRWWGHALIDFDFDMNGDVLDVNQIPPKHVIPEWGEWKVWDMDLRGLPYRNTPMMNYMIEVGGNRDLGLFKKAAPWALWKKNSIAFWSQFNEIFGIPFRLVKTPGRDARRNQILGDIMKNMGGSGYGVFQDDETVEIFESKASDPYKVFDNLILRANSEMSKLIIHQTMTSDNGSSRSQASVHEDVAEEVHMADGLMLMEIINDKLFPLLVKNGNKKLVGKKAVLDDTEILSQTDRIKIDGVIMQYNTDYRLTRNYLETTYGVEVEDKPIPTPQAPGGGNMGEPGDAAEN